MPLPKAPQPAPETLWPDAEAEVIAGDNGLAVGPKKTTILWGPSCFECRRHRTAAFCLGRIYGIADFDNFFELILGGSPKKAVAMFFMPAIKASCDTLRHDLNAYVQGHLPGAFACAKALVYYRRHSHHVNAFLSESKVDFFERNCDFFLCDIFHLAGHPLCRVR